MTETKPPLRRYDPERRCPKCGGYANTRWVHTHSNLKKAPFRVGYQPLCEWIHTPVNLLCRTCECGYQWDELPLDVVPAEGEVETPEGTGKVLLRRAVRIVARLMPQHVLFDKEADTWREEVRAYLGDGAHG